MDTFKKKSLCAALAGVGALGAAGTALAVNVNPDGLGQALIYPYYTVRTVDGDAYNSLLSVVNSTASAKGVKVRFLEGKNSREVLDFNLYLSAFDVWTAAIVPTDDGAKVITADKSCTTPPIPADGKAFVNFILNDGGGNSLDRTREGYVEIIEMGDVIAGTVSEAAIEHVGGVPSCAPAGLANAVISSNTVLGSGGLFGGMTLINVLQGTDFSMDATALESFRTVPPAIWAEPGSVLPDLTLAAPPVATVYTAGTAQSFVFTSGIDAVSATLMHAALMNEIVLDTVTASGTDWVITMPTKRHYVFPGSATSPADPPFQRNFGPNVGACDDILINVWDREERTGSTPEEFSPPQGLTNLALCWEANVLTWANSNVLGSTNSVNLNPGDIVSGYENGWARIDFTTASTGPVPNHQLAAIGGATFFGLPVVGFAVQSFNNDTLTQNDGDKIQSSYGGSFNHKYQRLITVPIAVGSN